MARRGQHTKFGEVLQAAIKAKRVWAIARQVGFVKRKGKINPNDFLWTLALGFGSGRARSISALRRTYKRVSGTSLVPSSFYDRFNGALVLLLRQVVAYLLRTLVAPNLRLRGAFAGFSDVVLTDSSVLRLRDNLATKFPACRTNHTKAAAKLHAVMSVNGESRQTVSITDERTNDRRAFRVGPWVQGRLLLFDLGYFGYRLFDRIDRNGGWFVSRLKSNSNPTIVSANREWRGRSIPVVGRPLKEVLGHLQREVLDVNIEVTFKRRAYKGRASQVTKTFRLVAVRNADSGEYHTYVTNVAADKLDAGSVALAYRARWEIELLFKAWKSEFRLDELPSRRKEVVEALIYASILTMIVTQRLQAFFRAKAGGNARRVTFGRVAAVVRHFASELLEVALNLSSIQQARRLGKLIQEEVLDPHRHRLGLLEQAAGARLEAA